MTYRSPLLFLLLAILLNACGSSDDDNQPQRIITNTVPVANEVIATMDKNSTKNITLNATDQNGDSLTYRIVTRPNHGVVNINDNTATYTPTAGYSGSDSFTYRVNDGTADSNTATVSMVIRAAAVTVTNTSPVAQEVSASTTENTAVTITLRGTDSDGDSLSYR